MKISFRFSALALLLSSLFLLLSCEDSPEDIAPEGFEPAAPGLYHQFMPAAKNPALLQALEVSTQKMLAARTIQSARFTQASLLQNKVLRMVQQGAAGASIYSVRIDKKGLEGS